MERRSGGATLRISNKIFLTHFPDSIKRAIKEAFSLPNPMFHKMKKMGKAYVYLSPFIKYYEEDRTKEVLAVPRGGYAQVKEIISRYDFAYEEVEEMADAYAELKDTITLRPYQEGVPEHIIAQNQGICRFDTGYGKTIIGLKVASLLKERTLIIVPKREIYRQFEKDIKTYFGFEAGGIEDLVDGTKPLVLTTLQGLQRRLGGADSRNPETVDQIRRAFGCILVDECHTVVPEKSRRVVEYFSARYRFGFTATPKRTDGQGKAIEFLFGPIIADGKVERASPEVEVIPFPGHIPMDEYAKIIEAQTTNEDRNEGIAKIVERDFTAGRHVLVLTKRTRHRDELVLRIARRIGVDCVTAYIAGRGRDQGPGHSRVHARPPVIVGTYSLLGTGVDIPTLDTLILAGDLRSDVLAEQSAGRCLRLLKGKKQPRITDIDDVRNPILHAQAKARMKFYREQGWKVLC